MIEKKVLHVLFLLSLNNKQSSRALFHDGFCSSRHSFDLKFCVLQDCYCDEFKVCLIIFRTIVEKKLI